MKRFPRVMRWTVAGLVALAVVAVSALAVARPGGGHSYSGGYSGGGGGGGWSGGGGGRSGGGGGGGGGGELIFDLIRLLIYLIVEVPIVGIPLLLIIFVLCVWFASQSNSDRGSNDWSTSYGSTVSAGSLVTTPQAAAPVRMREMLDRIRTFDPAFSPILFEDFVYSLFAAAHEARGAKKLDTLAAYLSPGARNALTQLAPNATQVGGIVVGAMHFTSVAGLGPNDTRVVVRVTFECNYTETLGDREKSYYAVESWRFERDRSARSKPADRSRVLACPNCGASLDQAIGGTCSYCKQNVGTGAFDWIVAAISFESREDRGAQLTGTVPERGTERPSIVDTSAPTRWAEIAQRDPSLDWTSFQARMNLVFRELQTAWSSRSWERARAFVSDNLFQSFSYWMAMYERQGLRNVTENAGITKVEIVRVATDAAFDAITVRIWASGLDYTVDANGSVVGGSKSKERAYSEYWTFVRGVTKRGEAKSDGKCPNCGADLKINMAGHCEYCRAKITTGDFDWVLSRIEQDESYTG